MRLVSELSPLKIVHYTKKVSLCLCLPAVFQHFVRPVGQGVKLDLNKKKSVQTVIVPQTAIEPE